MLADQLAKAWRERRGSVAIDAAMRFSDEGLVLGAGTVLAPSGDSGRDVSIEGWGTPQGTGWIRGRVRRARNGRAVHAGDSGGPAGLRLISLDNSAERLAALKMSQPKNISLNNHMRGASQTPFYLAMQISAPPDRPS